MRIKSVGVTSSGKVIITMDEGGDVRVYEIDVVRTPDMAKALRKENFPKEMVEEVAEALKRSIAPETRLVSIQEFMRTMRAFEFLQVLGSARLSERLPYSTAVRVLQEVCLAEKVMST